MRSTIAMCCLVMSIACSSAMASDPVKVAGIFATTGIATTNNVSHIQLVQLGVEVVNARGGLLGHPVELVLLDNQSSPIGSSLAAKKAVELRVLAVIGAAWSSHSLRIAPVLQAARIPMITGSSTNPRITRLGDYIFRVCFIDSFQARIMAEFAYSNLGARTTAVLEIINEEFSLTLAELFAKSFQERGGRVLVQDSYQNNAVDFADMLVKVKQAHPDVVYVPGYARDCGLLIKQAVGLGIQATFLGADGWAGPLIYESGGPAVAGSYYSAHWHYGVRTPASLELQKMYENKYHQKIPHMNAPLGYDAVLLLADAVARAGSLDRAKIRDALAETKGFRGVTGTITLDANGDPVDKPVVIMRLGKHEPQYFTTFKPRPRNKEEIPDATD